MHFHLTRRDVQNHVVSQYYFSQDQAQKILDYLESSGQITFAGAMFLVNSPDAQDAKNIEGLGRGSLGMGLGGAVSYYKVKSYLDDLLARSGQYVARRGLTTT